MANTELMNGTNSERSQHEALVLAQQVGGLDRWTSVILDQGMLDAVSRTDQTCLGIGVQLTREGSWWGKGGSVVVTASSLLLISLDESK
eukprot:3235437-Rhodomonas_salina.4